MTQRPTIIDFVEKYTAKYAGNVFLREKVNGVWTETTFRQTKEQAYRVGAGLMALGLRKGEKMALLSEGRNIWVIGELGILYAGGVNVPLSIKLEETNDLVFRVQHSDTKYVMTSASQIGKIRKILPETPNVEKVIVFDELPEYRENEIFIGDLMKMGDEFLAMHADEFEKRV